MQQQHGRTRAAYPYLHGALRHEEAVGRLEIPVDEPTRVNVLKALRDLQEDVHHLNSTADTRYRQTKTRSVLGEK